MLLFPNSPEIARISKLTSQYVMDCGWRVQKSLFLEENILIATKRDIKVAICFVDAKNQNSITPWRFIEALELYARDYRSKTGEGVVYVINADYAGLAKDNLISRGIALLTFDELTAITDLESLYEKASTPLDERTTLILRGCSEFCVTLSNICIGMNLYGQAKQYLSLITQDLHFVHYAHYMLVDLCIKTNDYDSARSFCMQCLLIEPNNTVFLQQLLQIEIDSGDQWKLAEVAERINKLVVEEPTFESIIAKQKSHQFRSEEVLKNDRKTNSGAAKFFDRFLRR